MRISNNVASECRIVYGGINPNFIRASKTEALLEGQNLYDNATLKNVFQSLDEEIICDYVLPDDTPEYRKNLAISLFYKVRYNDYNFFCTRCATRAPILIFLTNFSGKCQMLIPGPGLA